MQFAVLETIDWGSGNFTTNCFVNWISVETTSRVG